jgi:hypothetical protein
MIIIIHANKCTIISLLNINIHMFNKEIIVHLLVWIIIIMYADSFYLFANSVGNSVPVLC